jgi:hypothetical protein
MLRLTDSIVIRITLSLVVRTIRHLHQYMIDVFRCNVHRAPGATSQRPEISAFVWVQILNGPSHGSLSEIQLQDGVLETRCSSSVKFDDIRRLVCAPGDRSYVTCCHAYLRPPESRLTTYNSCVVDKLKEVVYSYDGLPDNWNRRLEGYAVDTHYKDLFRSI